MGRRGIKEKRFNSIINNGKITEEQKQFLNDCLAKVFTKQEFKTLDEFEDKYRHSKDPVQTHIMIAEIFGSFRQRIEFYKKYKYDWQSLFKEQEHLLDIWEKSEEYNLFESEMKDNNPFLAEGWYQDWLFDYCFGDIPSAKEYVERNNRKVKEE